MDVSVVVCTYTVARQAIVARLLDSLMAQSVAPREVFLVLDPIPELVESYRKVVPAGVQVLVAPRKGLSVGRNAGLAASSGDVVAFVDDDAVPEREWVADLIHAFGRNPDALAVGGHIEPDWERGRPAWFPPEFDWIVGCTYGGHPQDESEVRALIGANMAFRREELQKVGGFKESFGRVGSMLLSGEDTDACIRLRDAFPAGRILFTPGARVHHHVPASRGKFAYFCKRAFYAGMSIRLLYSHHESPRVRSTEGSYLKRLFRRAKGTLAQRASRFVAKLVGVGAVGCGYIAGMVYLARAKRSGA